MTRYLSIGLQQRTDVWKFPLIWAGFLVAAGFYGALIVAAGFWIGSVVFWIAATIAVALYDRLTD